MVEVLRSRGYGFSRARGEEAQRAWVAKRQHFTLHSALCMPISIWLRFFSSLPPSQLTPSPSFTDPHSLPLHIPFRSKMMLGVDNVAMSSSNCSTGGGGGGGCQSGWTMYLDQSNSYSNRNHAMHEDNEEEDLDLSMLSDASSGPSPALFHEDLDNDDFLANDRSKKTSTRAQTDHKQKKIIKSSSNNPNSSYNLDDTASSTLYEHAFGNIDGAVDPAALHHHHHHHHPVVVDFSSSSSTTQFKEKSVFDSRLSYYQSPPVAKPMPQSQRVPHVRKENGKKKMR